MGRKLLLILSIVLILLFAAWLAYHHMARSSPSRPPVASQWPSVLPAAPSASPTAPAVPPASREPPTKAAPAAAEPVFVLRQGETLDYDANIAQLNSTVARLKISAVEKRNSSGKAIWHLQALAHTENPYRMVFELDDQFDSYSHADSFASVQYEMHLNERGQKVDTVQRMLTSVQDPLPDQGSGVRVPPGTRDPLGMLQCLRSTDWGHTAQLRSPVFDGRKLYDVRAALIGKANSVHVPAGTFNTLKIELRVFENGQEMKDAHFILYLTNDLSRLPILMEAVLPVATARVELTKSK